MKKTVPYIALTIISLSIFAGVKFFYPKRYSGYVEGQLLYMASPSSGTLKTLNVNRGDIVKAGQEIYALDSNPEAYLIATTQKKLRQATNTLIDLKRPKRIQEIKAIEDQIAQVQAQLTLAAIRVKRQEALFKKNATEKDTLDSAIANLQYQQDLKAQYEQNLALAKRGSRAYQIKAQADAVNAIEIELEKLRWDLKQKTGIAPADAQVFDIYYSLGEWVASGQPVASLLNHSIIRIEYFIPVVALNHHHVGQKVYFYPYGQTKKALAEIIYISPDAEFMPPLVFSRENQDKLVYRIKADILTPHLFKPGQPVQVSEPLHE